VNHPGGASGVGFRVLVQNGGGQAANRIPNSVAQRPGCDFYGFVETMLAEDTVSKIEHLLPGYAVWHCVRPRPSRGRPHGGISLFVRCDSVWHTSTGFKVASDPAAGILWVEIRRFKLIVAICYFSPHGSQV
jgi:hypothetical protein